MSEQSQPIMSGGSSTQQQRQQEKVQDVELQPMELSEPLVMDAADADAAAAAADGPLTPAKNDPKGKQRESIAATPPLLPEAAAPTTSAAGAGSPGKDSLSIADDAATAAAAGGGASASSPDGGPVCNITLLLPTGARHPYRIDEIYLSKRNVEVPELTEDGRKDPFSESVYKLKELILREWRDEWDGKPASPSSIRLIHFGKLLDDKEQLKSEEAPP